MRTQTKQKPRTTYRRAEPPSHRPLRTAPWRTLAAVAAALAIFGLLVLGRRVLGQVGFLGAAGSGDLVAGAAALFVLALLPVVVLPHRLLRAHLLVLISVLGLWAVVVTALGGVLLDAVLAGATGVTCFATGRLVSSRLGLRGRVPWPAELTAGAGLVATTVLLVGRVGLLSTWTVGLEVLLVPLAIAALAVRRHGSVGAAATTARRAATGVLEDLAASRVAAGAFACLAVAGGAAVVWTSAPEIQFDAVYAKAWLPAQWAADGRIGPSLDHPVLNMTGASQLLAVPAHTLGAPAVGRFLQLLTGAALAVALWQCGQRSGSAWRGPVAAVVVVLTPHVIWQASTAYDDLVLAFLALSVSLAAVALPAADRLLGSAVLLGLAGGACVAGKLHLAPYAAVLLAAWVLVQHGGAGRLRALLGVAAGGAIVALPGPLLSWAATGNPVFPQYNAVFRSPYYLPVNEKYNFPFTPDGSLSALVRLPWDAIREPSRYVEVVPAGGFGLLPPLLLVAVLVGWRLGRRWLPVWAALVLATAYWWLSFRYLRYALPTMVVSAALLTHVAPRSRPPAMGGRTALAAPVAAVAAMMLFALALVPSTLASFWNIPERFPIRVALGLVDRDAYEKAHIGDDVLRQFNELAAPGDVLVGRVHARTLLREELDLTPSWELNAVLTATGPLPDDPQAIRDMAGRRGVNWASVTDGGDLSTTNELVASMVETFGIPVFAADNIVLFRLADKPVGATAKRPIPLCDPGFVGGVTCWGTSLDLVPGIGSAEAPGGVSQTVPVCGGATYRGTVQAADASGSLRVHLSTDAPVARTSGVDAAGGRAASAVVTVPEGASTLTVYVAALGPATAQRVSLERVDAGPDC